LKRKLVTDKAFQPDERMVIDKVFNRDKVYIPRAAVASRNKTNHIP
jgi:hypothetical protein